MITNLKPDVYNFLAIDIGASSGRAILASIDTQGNVITREIHRFTHPIVRMSGQCYWDIYFLYEQIIESLKRVAEEGIRLTSIGIDTWGVDFVLCSNTGEILRQPYSYRDPQTKGVSERYFQEQLSANELYRKTGIQVMDFNTVFQLYALRLRHDQVLQMADKILFMSDALSYMLTGNMVMEYTIASTSGMINAQTKELDEDILRTLSLTRQHFAPMVQPGSVIGMLLPEIRQVTGVNEVPVVAVAGHDTASAVAAVKAMNEHFAYLSSGTWSLMGIVSPHPIINAKTEKYNFTNEGGVNGTVRVLKNICGMWLLERCRQEWGQVLPYDELFGEVAKARGEECDQSGRRTLKKPCFYDKNHSNHL